MHSSRDRCIHLEIDAFILRSMHSSRDRCIHLEIDAFISRSMHSSRDRCIHLEIDAFISRSMHSSRDRCVHLEIDAFISRSMHSSRDRCVHLEIDAFISRSMHSSRDRCIHLEINAFISRSMHSSRDQCIHLEIDAFISKLTDFREANREKSPWASAHGQRNYSHQLLPLIAINGGLRFHLIPHKLLKNLVIKFQSRSVGNWKIRVIPSIFLLIVLGQAHRTGTTRGQSFFLIKKRSYSINYPAHAQGSENRHRFSKSHAGF